jgi:hypothetical protein
MSNCVSSSQEDNLPPSPKELERYILEPQSVDDASRVRCERFILENEAGAHFAGTAEGLEWCDILSEAELHWAMKEMPVQLPAPAPVPTSAAKLAMAACLALAVVCAVGIAWTGQAHAAAAARYERVIRSLREQLESFFQMKNDLGLNNYVGFMPDSDPRASMDPTKARPIFVAGDTIRTMGWVRSSLIERLDIYVTDDFRSRVSASAPDRKPDQTVTFPKVDGVGTVPFNEQIPLPGMDDRVREVTLQLVPYPEAVQAASQDLRPERLRYQVYIKCSKDYGPLTVDPDAGGKLWPTASNVVDISRHYVPSGIFGDVGDVAISFGSEGGHRFVYEPKGRGPHEPGESKYDLLGKLNDKPCGFAGCYWLHPANNWGTAEGGFDLRNFRPGHITFKARSLGEPIHVAFQVGTEGKVWHHSNGKNPEWKEPEYVSTLRTFPLGLLRIEKEWVPYALPLDDIPEQEWKRVICAFAWSITSGIDADRKFEFEIKDIQFTK